MLRKNCAVWFTLLTRGFCMHSVDGSNQTQQTTACDVFGTCSQICTHNADKVSCLCADGFKLKGNGWGCSPIDANWKIFYHTMNRWWVLSMWKGETKNKTKAAYPRDVRPSGITYDARNNEIYTTGSNSGRFSVFRTKLQNGTSVELFNGMVFSYDLAFDWTTGNIYFADANYFRIFVCKNHSNICAVLIDESVNQPVQIALHPASGLLFWTEYGATSGIMRAGMDGSQPLEIISIDSPLWYPTGLTVDSANERIYFAVYKDVELNAIQSSRFDGSDQKVVISGEIAGDPSGLNVFGDRIIWYDGNSGKIQSAEKFNGLNNKVHTINVLNTFGLVVFHVANQPVTGTSPCVGANCSHICTIGPQVTFKCFCPAGKQLAEDRKICTETNDSAKLVVASKATFKTTIIGSIEKEAWESSHSLCKSFIVRRNNFGFFHQVGWE